MCGKYFKRKHKIVQQMQIKHKHILVPGQRYQDSRHFLQNTKVSKNVMGFNNHTQRSTPPYYLDVDNPLGCTKVFQKFQKCGLSGKCPKRSKNLWGEVKHILDKVKIKAAFFLEAHMALRPWI